MGQTLVQRSKLERQEQFFSSSFSLVAKDFFPSHLIPSSLFLNEQQSQWVPHGISNVFVKGRTTGS